MRRKKEINVFNISFLDLLSGALGAVIILFIAVPKAKNENSQEELTKRACSVTEKILDKCLNDLDAKKSEIQKLVSDSTMTSQTIEKLKDEIKATQSKKVEEKQKTENIQGKGEADIGFKFKGKNIIFLIDVSGSMIGEKIGQVKAGLKMLIASMGKDYSVDIVYFPHTRNQTHYALWGVSQPLTNEKIKDEVYGFLYDLQARGDTPTRAALIYALTNYPDATDIVLLSDGMPTVFGTTQIDSSDEIINDVMWHNSRKIQINTIGVGRSFLKNSNSNLYKFLKELSQKTNGFFYGF